VETITIVREGQPGLKVRILKSVADKHGIKPMQSVSAEKAAKLVQQSKAAREGGAK
jgi:hypothetical protein